MPPALDLRPRGPRATFALMLGCTKAKGLMKPIAKLSIASALASVLVFSAGPAVQGANPDDAKDILKRMTDYVAAQKTISARYDSDIEVVTTEGQKISFNSSGQLLMQRPDKLRVSRTGGYADVDMVFDGKTLDILSKDQNKYTQIEAPGTLGQLVERIRDKTDADLPAADLFASGAYAELTRDLISAKHIGQGVINGVECEHLAFRTQEVDWQVWVETGANPIPRKYVVTSKTVTGQPQYSVRINDWQTNVPVTESSFAFTPPAGATKVAAASLKQMDEVPAGVTIARN